MGTLAIGKCFHSFFEFTCKKCFNFARKHCKKGNQWFIRIMKIKIHFAYANTTSTACASSVFLSSSKRIGCNFLLVKNTKLGDSTIEDQSQQAEVQSPLL